MATRDKGHDVDDKGVVLQAHMTVVFIDHQHTEI